MSDETKEFQVADRDEMLAEMYKDYLEHMSVKDMVEKYAMSKANVYKIVKDKNWASDRKKLKQDVYRKIDEEYKEYIVDIVRFFQRDINLLIQKCLKEERAMTIPERDYFLQMYEKFSKEVKLTQGAPTEITGNTGIVEHRIILPPGVKRFGVIPPPPNVIQVESEELTVPADPETEKKE